MGWLMTGKSLVTDGRLDQPPPSRSDEYGWMRCRRQSQRRRPFALSSSCGHPWNAIQERASSPSLTRCSTQTRSSYLKRGNLFAGCALLLPPRRLGEARTNLGPCDCRTGAVELEKWSCQVPNVQLAGWPKDAPEGVSHSHSRKGSGETLNWQSQSSPSVSIPKTHSTQRSSETTSFPRSATEADRDLSRLRHSAIGTRCDVGSLPSSQSSEAAAQSRAALTTTWPLTLDELG